MKVDYLLNDWPHLGEFSCRCGHAGCDLIVLSRELIHADIEIQEQAPEGAFDTITSGFRCAYWNDYWNGSRGSLHLKGMALDRLVGSISLADAFRVLEQSCLLGGIGVYLGNTHRPFVHYDVGPSGRRWGRLNGKYISGMRGVLAVLEEEEKRGRER